MTENYPQPGNRPMNTAYLQVQKKGQASNIRQQSNAKIIVLINLYKKVSSNIQPELYIGLPMDTLSSTGDTVMLQANVAILDAHRIKESTILS